MGSVNLTISEEEYDSLWCKPNPPSHDYSLLLDEGKFLFKPPESLGQHGYVRLIKLFSGVWLDIFNY
jgi:hypothetical protein